MAKKAIKKSVAAPKKATSGAASKKAATSATTKKKVTFSVAAEPGSRVFVSGDFNNWDPAGRAMVDKNGDGNYTATIVLAPGVYEYKFIVNDTWSVDPNCTEWVQNSLGTLNSVLRV